MSALHYAARQGALDARARAGQQGRRHQPGRSRRRQRAALRDDQRSLRHGGAAAREGRESEPCRCASAGPSLYARHRLTTGSKRRAAPGAEDARRATAARACDARDCQGREPERADHRRAAAALDAGQRRLDARRRDAAVARGQDLRRRVGRAAARGRRRPARAVAGRHHAADGRRRARTGPTALEPRHRRGIDRGHQGAARRGRRHQSRGTTAVKPPCTAPPTAAPNAVVQFLVDNGAAARRQGQVQPHAARRRDGRARRSRPEPVRVSRQIGKDSTAADPPRTDDRSGLKIELYAKP